MSPVLAPVAIAGALASAGQTQGKRRADLPPAGCRGKAGRPGIGRGTAECTNWLLSRLQLYRRRLRLSDARCPCSEAEAPGMEEEAATERAGMF